MPAEGSGGSIRRTLWLYLGALSALGALVLFFVARGYGQRAADQSYDHLLVASALSIADSVALVEGQWQVDLPYAALDLLAMAPEDRVFYRVADAGGHATITGYADLPPPPRAVMPGQPLLFDAAYSGETVRFVTVARQVASASAQGEVWVQVGQTRLARNALAQDMVARALLVIGVLSLLSLALVGLGVHRALRPLVRIERDLARRDPSDLAPLGVAPPRELQRMVAALNHFMQRLAGSHEAQRAFMAEAAHQMRTPLAALRAQAQTALDEDEPAELRRSLATIERNANHMSRLLNQLLSDASVAHRADLRAFAQVDLAEVVRQAVAEALPQAGPRPSLQLALGDAPALLRGDALLLREAVKNLIDNACKYAGDAPLEVTLHGEDDAWVLRVADRGPGVADADAGRLFERFTRGTPAPAGGAGLGLAIVRRVVEGHGGNIELRNRDGGGMAVILRLPKGNSL